MAERLIAQHWKCCGSPCPREFESPSLRQKGKEMKIKNFSLICDECGSKNVKLKWDSRNMSMFLFFLIRCQDCENHEETNVGIIP